MFFDCVLTWITLPLILPRLPFGPGTGKKVNAQLRSVNEFYHFGQLMSVMSSSHKRVNISSYLSESIFALAQDDSYMNIKDDCDPDTIDFR